MKFIRGTTPDIDITVKTEIDLHQVTQVWIYISQQDRVKVDKVLQDIEFDYEHRKMRIRLTQKDTLGLFPGEAVFQIRVLMSDNTALATDATKVEIEEIYKDGVITEGT